MKRMFQELRCVTVKSALLMCTGVLTILCSPCIHAAECINAIHYLCADWGPDLNAKNPESADEVIYFIKKIDFACREQSPSQSEGPSERLWFCKMNWDGSSKREICELWAGQKPSVATEGDNMWLSVCPKARKAVFSTRYGGGVSLGLWLVDLDGKNLRLLLRPEFTNGNARVCMHPSMNPNGDQVVYSAVQAYPVAQSRQASRLEILDVRTGKVRILTDELEDDHPGWSPNGDWIVFTHYWRADPGKIPRRIWLIKPDGSEKKPIMGSYDDFGPGLNDKQELFAWYPAWSHDGKWIYALSGNPCFYVVDVAQGKTIVYQHALLDGKDISIGRAQFGKKGFVFSGLSVWVVVASPPQFKTTQLIDRCQSAQVPADHFEDLSSHDLRWGESSK